MDFGPPELIILVVLVLVLFGGAQLPKLARNLGKAQSEFKAGLAEMRDGATTPDDKPEHEKAADA
jgi:sec-independent protein translocase protein TatA